MNTDTNQEKWQVEANGQIYESDFAELASWIGDGALLRQDKVRKGNLRWIEAGKVPSLITFFNAKDAGQPIGPIVTTTEPDPISDPIEPVLESAPTQNFVSPTVESHEPARAPDACAVHADVQATYVCATCSSLFCKACPNSYGGSVKICPHCGAMCKLIAELKAKVHCDERVHTEIGKGFGFGDFAQALAHPFKFKTSLILGAVMFMLFSLGQSAVAFGGIIMMFSALICFLFANMLTFGILANTVDNFTQGRLDENFMPSFDDFSLWDDVVHPFFLSIGVYLSSFGPFLAVMFFAIFMVTGSGKTEMNGLQSDAARTINPELPYAANAVKQSEKVRELLNKTQAFQKKRVESMEKGEIEPEQMAPGTAANSAITTDPDEEYFNRTNQMIQDSRKAQLESAIGKTPETVAKERAELFARLLKFGALFLILGGVTLLWGLFYFPAACAVAGYTRSFTATINPVVGLDTIRRLGSTYVLILVMGLVLIVVSSVVGGLLSVIFAPFDLPAMGNIPAKALGSMFGFYISVVFSCIIGYALFKASDRLKLYR